MEAPLNLRETLTLETYFFVFWKNRDIDRDRERLWSCCCVGMDNVLHKLRKLDAYPKINEDFYSRTFSGGLITLVSFIVIFLLFFSELSMLLSLSLSLSLKIYLFIYLKLCEFWYYIYIYIGGETISCFQVMGFRKWKKVNVVLGSSKLKSIWRLTLFMYCHMSMQNFITIFFVY